MNEALKIHRKLKGKIGIKAKIKAAKNNIHLIYTPGVAEVAREIAKNPKKSFLYTSRGNNVAIITDGTRTIGVGNTIPEASMPIMEGKALFLNSLAKIDAYPLCLGTKIKEEIIRTIEILAPNFAAINIEDIQTPKVLEIMEELSKKDLIVFHDDQQGVAIVVLAALINALKVVGKKMEKVRICLGGAGAAGYGIFKILNYSGIKNIVVFDQKGIVYKGREGDNKYTQEIAEFTNPENLKGGKEEAIRRSDVFVGVTGVGNLLTASDIKIMNEKPIIFALSNPVPEIFPKEIKIAEKEFIFASGRSDFQNQINNIIVFPGVFRGLVDYKKKMNLKMEFEIAKCIASLVKKPNPHNIIPGPFDKRLVKTIRGCIRRSKN